MTPSGFRHVYVHIPFCSHKCPYCDFYSEPVAGQDRDGDLAEFFERYDSALLQQAKGACLEDLCGSVETLYFGGGTPTVMGGRLVGLVRSLVERYSLDPDGEVTVEVNPESADPELLESLASAGVTRMSVGVQSLDDAVLSTLGRVHDAEAAQRAVTRVAREGMDAALDLICGVPGQGMASWHDTLERAVQTGAGHISVYPLTLEPDTPMHDWVERGELPAPDSEETAEMMVYAQEQLSTHGIFRYEVSNYARPGEEARHNSAYWTGQPYLGLGPSAHSMCDAATAVAASIAGAGTHIEGRVRFSTVSDVAAYVQDPSGPLAEVEVLSPRSAAVEDVMMGMRMVVGVRIATVDDLGLLPIFEKMGEDGLVEQTEGHWRATELGWLLGNEVFGRIWEAR